MTQNIPSHIGSFRVKKVLTEKLDCGSWVIYRDPENGIYLYNVETREEFNPLLWNLTISSWTEKTRNMLLSDIKRFEAGEYWGY